MTTTAPPDAFGTALICDALTAYRRDLERTPDIVQFGDEDARWLQLALRLERLTAPATERVRRSSPLARHPALRPKRLLAVAEQMESAGALTLAFTTLAAARRVWDNTDPPSAGIAIFRQARICRTSGATQAAENFYSFLFTFATRHRLPELRGRAWVGRGLLRMLAGDSSAAYAWFAKARAASAYHPAAVAVSYHGEMAAALAQDDGSRALLAGWKALETGALSSYDDAGVMVNLADLALRAGRPKAALHLVRQAMQRSRHPRVRLIAFSKGALAAAALDRPHLVERFSRLLVSTATRVNIPFEELEARSELAEAFARVGETTRARRLARSVRAEAAAQHFVAIVRRCDAVLAADPVEEVLVSLTAPARRLVAELEAV